jgi:ribosomal protein L13E
MVHGLKYCQIAVAAFTLVLYMVVAAPVAYRREYKDTGSRFRSFLAVWTKSLTGYYTIYLVLAVLGMLQVTYEMKVGEPHLDLATDKPSCAEYDADLYGTILSGDYCVFEKDVGPLFNSLLLYDIFVISSTSLDVIRAVYKPAKQLMSTVVLGIFTIYTFSLVLFITDASSLPKEECDTLSNCFKVSFGMGLRNGGGIGDHLDDATMGGRYWLDLAFFVMVLIVLLNTVFGITIDTFSELREEKKEKEADIQGKCFICNVDKAKFDMQGTGIFLKHIRTEHSMWAYLNFMILIKTQDKDEDDGLESHVRECIEQRSIDWFPTIRDGRSDDHQDEAGALDKSLQLIAKLVRKSADEVRQEVRQLEAKLDMVTEAGFSARELKEAGFSARKLKEAGFSARELKEAGFSARELIPSRTAPRRSPTPPLSPGSTREVGQAEAAALPVEGTPIEGPPRSLLLGAQL